MTGIYVTLMTGIFGSAEARMGYFTRRQCRSEGKFPLEDMAAVVAKTRWVFNLESLLGSHLDLTLNIAHGGVILDDNPDELERDHIFPKSLLARGEWPDAKINHYANFHFLRQKDNRNKTDKPPHEWFRAPGKSPAYTDQEMDDRLLSWDLIEPEAFDSLLDTRGQRIRERALQMFHMSEDDFNKLF